MSKVKNSIVMGTPLMAALMAFYVYFESGTQGSHLVAFQDQGGIWTICDGITKGVTPGMRVTQEWCDKKLVETIESHTAPLDKIDYQMTDGARIGWGDAMLNLGGRMADPARSTPWRRLQSGDWYGSCEAFLMYRYTPVGKEKRDCSRPSSGCSGIWTRRVAQRDVCQGRITVAQFLKLVRGTPMKQLEVIDE